MSGSVTISTPSPPSVAEVATRILAFQAAQTGVPSDSNIGSQIRTFGEAIGEVNESTGIVARALAFQAMVYGAMAAFSVEPLGADPSNGTLTFSTGTGGSPPPATVNVTISSGTIVQTQGGTQFQTLQDVTLVQGATSVTVPAAALQPGAAGNVAAGSISVINSSLPYPLIVSNVGAFVGGADAETPAQTLARFTAKVASLGLASPVSIANAVIGVQSTTSNETVRKATVFEAWITQPVGSQVAGFQVVIDNGSGAASADLITAVTTLLNGSFVLNESGFRPAGVPYSVVAVTPVNASVIVTATLTNKALISAMTASVETAVSSYFASLAFGAPAEQPQISAAVSNTLSGIVSSLSVSLLNSTGTVVTEITATGVQRVILTTQTATLS